MKGEVKLTRTDKRPLVFIGDEIFNGTTKGHDSTRWSVLRIFKTDKHFVVGIAKLTCWDGERDSYSAEKRKTKDEVLNLVQEEVPELRPEVSMALEEWS